ncbi:MAG: DUF1326 domain-containing protein [Pirellulales bacterium]|nr:DUF1326 domain-containing protein [Pirellulales bacterium]
MSKLMISVLSLCLLCWGSLCFAGDGTSIEGDYMEMRTCDIYTGPCFANAEISLAGKQAIMAWKIDRGTQAGVDLTGLNVVLVVSATDTLSFGGSLYSRPEPIESVILVDARANPQQRDALAEFVQQQAGKVAGTVKRVDAVEIEMSLNHISMESTLSAGEEVQMVSRKLKHGDCVCTNEVLYYPPLADVTNSAAAFTVEGSFQGKGLPVTWSNLGTRSTYLATFAY